jgi:ketosteroid isomerase-like protein
MKINLLYIILFLNSVLFAQSGPEISEQNRFEAQVTKDTVLLEKLLDDDLVYVHSNALVESKADFLNSIGGGGIQYLEMGKMSGEPVRRWGKTALMTGLIAVKGIYRQSPFEVQLRYTSVYRKDKGLWKLVSWQSTKIP